MKKLILILALFIALKFLLISYFLFYFKPLNHDLLFEVSEGDSSYKVFNNLHINNITVNKYIDKNIFRFIHFFNSNLFFKAGEYQFNSSHNYYSILKKIVIGDIYLRKFTVIEGETVTNVINDLNKNKYLSGNINYTPKEGSLLPETYSYKKGYDRNNLLKKMQSDMILFLDKIWENRDKTIAIKSKEELLILASIVEKESALNSEKDHIAGIFLNRIKKNMKLQSCPTTIYAITKGKYKFSRPLSKRDLAIKSFYNTYYVNGLPPTPICNPSKSSILATANPKETKDLYFVSDGQGSHRFSDSYAGHNKNVKLLRKYEKSQKK